MNARIRAVARAHVLRSMDCHVVLRANVCPGIASMATAAATPAPDLAWRVRRRKKAVDPMEVAAPLRWEPIQTVNAERANAAARRDARWPASGPSVLRTINVHRAFVRMAFVVMPPVPDLVRLAPRRKRGLALMERAAISLTERIRTMNVHRARVLDSEIA